MDTYLDSRAPQSMRSYALLKKLAITFAVIVFLIALATIAGWQFNIEILKRPIPGLVAMHPLTACCFAASSLAIGLRLLQAKSKSKTWACAILGMTGLFCCLVYLLQVSMNTAARIDQVLFSAELKTDNAGHIINRMAITTAFGFLFLNGSLLLNNFYQNLKVTIAHVLAVIVVILGLFSIIGYIYRVYEFYAALSRLPMAFHTAICFCSCHLPVCLFSRAKASPKRLHGYLLPASQHGC